MVLTAVMSTLIFILFNVVCCIFAYYIWEAFPSPSNYRPLSKSIPCYLEQMESKQITKIPKTSVTMKKPNGPPPEGEKKSREEVMAERARKKAESKLKKELAKANVPNQPADANPKKETSKTNVRDQNSDGTQKQSKQKPEKSAKNGPQTKGHQVPHPRGHQVPQPQDHQAPKRSALKTSSPEGEKNLQPSKVGEKETVSVAERQQPYITANSTNVYAPFKVLVAKCEAEKIQGINELLEELHHTLINFLEIFAVDDGTSYKAALIETIQPQLSFLTSNGRHPFPLAAGNLIRQFRKEINTYSEDDDGTKVKKELIDWLEKSLELNFKLAEKAITDYTLSKLKTQTDKNILTYGRCPVVEKIILNAKDEGLNVHVYVVDDPAVLSGRILLENLNEVGIPCTYGFINSVGYLMEICSVVLLGCSAILSNGRVVAPRGSGLIALNAQIQNLPVLVAAKTCTFVDKIRLDEHLSTALLTEPLESIGEDLVTALITDLRILPPSSAPAVLKAKKLGSE